MSRDPSRPIPPVASRFARGVCGYALDEDGTEACAAPAPYTFRVKGWPAWRFGNTCPEHAQLVRHWDLEYLKTRTGVR